MPEVKATAELRIDNGRLCRRIAELAEIGAIEGDGVCRLALTTKIARDATWFADG